MWRRVASQSPTKSPSEAEATPEEYLTAWEALGKMLANGRSLSGRERHCAFLNTGGAQFADISAAAGFDFPDDGRGLALVDWDHDGDLDVWITNRNGPRLRFLRNDYHAGHHFLVLRLQGVHGNRDGIGARVEVRVDSGTPLIKSLRAGDGYLGQSGKAIHFGLGEQESVDRVIVHWPGGQREEFRNVTADRRYLLVEGSGVARPQGPRSEPVQLAASPAEEPSTPASTRIVLPARLPLPTLAYRTFDGREQWLQPAPSGRPLLINLWATWCQPCLEEISQWTSHQGDLGETGAQIVLLCVDEATDAQTANPAHAQELLRHLNAPFDYGVATPDLLDKLDVTQQVLTKRMRSLPVPSSFLVDASGRLAVVYKGPTSVEQLLTDIRSLSGPGEQVRDLAVPFPGRWYTNPFPPDVLAIPRRFGELGQPSRALDYLQRHIADIQIQPARKESLHEAASAENLAELFVSLAMSLQQQGDRARVIEALQAAVRVRPADTKSRLALAMVYQQEGRPHDAVQQYKEALARKPNDPVVSNNLAWLLATSPDDRVRAPREAIQLAEEVCRQSHRQFPPALDTLAVAYASAGDYERARATLREAIGLLEKRGTTVSQELRQRLSLFERNEPFVDQ